MKLPKGVSPPVHPEAGWLAELLGRRKETWCGG